MLRYPLSCLRHRACTYLESRRSYSHTVFIHRRLQLAKSLDAAQAYSLLPNFGQPADPSAANRDTLSPAQDMKVQPLPAFERSRVLRWECLGPSASLPDVCARPAATAAASSAANPALLPITPAPPPRRRTHAQTHAYARTLARSLARTHARTHAHTHVTAGAGVVRRHSLRRRRRRPAEAAAAGGADGATDSELEQVPRRGAFHARLPYPSPLIPQPPPLLRGNSANIPAHRPPPSSPIQSQHPAKFVACRLPVQLLCVCVCARALIASPALTRWSRPEPWAQNPTRTDELGRAECLGRFRRAE